MTTERTNVYEGLFLFPHAATANLQAAVDHVRELLRRASAEVISLSKWDERRLAYEIKGTKRGLYLLAYFRAAAGAMSGLERDCNLSEQLLRSMIIRADHLPEEEMRADEGRLEAEIKEQAEQSEAEPAAR